MLHIVFRIQEMLSSFSSPHLCRCHAPAPLSGREGEKTQEVFRGLKAQGR